MGYALHARSHAGMAWIPGGDFIMGSNSAMANLNERPEHPVHVNGFWMDKTDVTNTQFAAFVKATGYGLYDMAGNVWQWVADWYRADAFVLQAQNQTNSNPQGPTDSYDPAHASEPVNAPKRVIRGGSFLCDPNFCASYRPSARRGVDPYNPMAHIGFRLVS